MKPVPHRTPNDWEKIIPVTLKNLCPVPNTVSKYDKTVITADFSTLLTSLPNEESEDYSTKKSPCLSTVRDGKWLYGDNIQMMSLNSGKSIW